jgi:hypothetical protein
MTQRASRGLRGHALLIDAVGEVPVGDVEHEVLGLPGNAEIATGQPRASAGSP